jgi:hypothetical protein
VSAPGTNVAEPTAEAGCAGVHVERRLLLGLPLALVGGRVLAGTPLAAQEAAARAAEGAFAPLELDEFGKRWQALAEALRAAPETSDESYAAQLAGLVARVPVAALPRLDTPRRPGLTGGLAWFLAPCALIEFRMDPGAVMRPHNHPPQVVLSLCAEGEVAYRHFEIEGEAPPCTEIDGAFLARETRAGFLAAGRSTSLTRVRDGIHGFVAGKQGARLIDFTVATTADIETFSYIELSSEPFERERRVYEARWIGKR